MAKDIVKEAIAKATARGKKETIEEISQQSSYDFNDLLRDAHRRRRGVTSPRAMPSDAEYEKRVAEKGNDVVTFRILYKQLLPAISEVIRDVLINQIDTLVLHVNRLEAELAELKTRPQVKYLGPWKETKSYSAGSMVTFQGAIFHANANTNEKPGASADWTLAVKSGRQD